MSKRKFPGPLSRFTVLLALLAILSLLDAAFNSLRDGRPVLGDLWIPFPGFDFYDYTPRFPLLHQRLFFTAQGSFPWIYPAPAIFVLYPFYLISSPTRWHLGYALFALLAFVLNAGAAYKLGRALRQRGFSLRQVTSLLGSVAILGWPVYFALQRGNIEILLWVGIAAAVYLIATQRYATGALLLGAVGSVKTYPLLFIGLLLLKKRFRESCLTIMAALVTTLLALRFLEPDTRDAWYQIRTGVAEWTRITTGEYFASGIGPDHSLLGLLRQCTFGAILHSTHALPIYLAVVGTLTASVFLVRMQRLPTLNQTLFLACAAILLPPTSYDYTLLLLFIPCGWMVLVCAERAHAGQSTDALTTSFLLFAVALAPLTFLHTWTSLPMRFEGPARCVVLLGLMVYAAVVPITPSGHLPSGKEPVPTRWPGSSRLGRQKSGASRAQAGVPS